MTANPQLALRDRIAETMARADGWEWAAANFSTLSTPAADRYRRCAEAVLIMLRGCTLRELEQLYRPNTPPSRPEPRLPDHTVNEEEAPNPIKQRADCTELEWAEQERARFERLYTRETVRGDLAEARADTAARDADIYQQRLERLGEGYTRERKRAEQATAEAEQLRTSQSTNTFTAADLVAALRAAGAERDRLDAADRTTVLNAAAQRLYTSLFPAVYNDLGQKAAEGVNRAVSELRRLAAEPQQTETETPDDLAAARATNQRLNLRAQQLESELATYRRAVAQWRTSERGTYVPLRTLAAIARAAGLDIETPQWLLHYQRVEQADAVIERARSVLSFAREVAATSGPGPASAAQAIADRLSAALAPAASVPVEAAADGEARLYGEDLHSIAMPEPADDGETPWYGMPGCTCKPWITENGKRRFMEPGETVDYVSGWHAMPNCPHHAVTA